LLERPGHPAADRLFAARALKGRTTDAQLRVDWSGGRPAAQLEAAFSARPGSSKAKRLLWQLAPVARN